MGREVALAWAWAMRRPHPVPEPIEVWPRPQRSKHNLVIGMAKIGPCRQGLLVRSR
jgi:hypothetical protein